MARASDWLIVHHDALTALEGQRIIHQAPGIRPPEITASQEVELARSHPSYKPRLQPIVRLVLDAGGTIAKAQILKGPDDRQAREAVVRALKQWRLRPALLDGEPVAVYFNVVLEVRWLEEGADGGGGAGRGEG